jgi:hypothetical protein
MNLTQYTPRINDRDLLDFISDVTAIINGGRIGVGVISASPSSLNSVDGEMRIYKNGNDVRLFVMTGNVWYGFQNLPVQQSGWGYIVVGAGNPGYQVATVTFPSPFASPPLVLTSYIGTTATAPTTIVDITNANTLRSVASFGVSTTGFSIVIQNSAGGAMATGAYEAFAWHAIST